MLGLVEAIMLGPVEGVTLGPAEVVIIIKILDMMLAMCIR